MTEPTPERHRIRDWLDAHWPQQADLDDEEDDDAP